MLSELKQLHRRYLRPALSGVFSIVYPPVCVGCQNAAYFKSSIGESRISEFGPAPTETDFSANSNCSDFASDEQKILAGESWCQNCLDQIREPLEQRCQVCGAITQIHAALKGRCHLCQFSDYHFSQAICINNYHGLLQDLIIKMKGQRCEVTAMQLGELLGYEIQRLEMIDSVDVMTCVPTHWFKKLRKGFQASELICNSASKICGIPTATKLLTANRPTKKQGMLSDFKRYENVKDAFSVTPIFLEKIKDKHILLIDDVMTSGATTSQCAKALRAEGASRVDVAVVARGAKAR